MACALLIGSINLARIVACYSMLVSPLQQDKPPAEATLVQVNIITETPGDKAEFKVKGKRIEDYSPTFVQDFASTGIVINNQGDVLTFLGYRWVDIQNHNPRVEITTSDGKKIKGQLIGIDQTNSAAVIHANGNLTKTPICSKCEVKGGLTVVAPVIAELDPSQYQEAQIRSVGVGLETQVQGSLSITLNRPFPDVGQPILTADHRVLGFIAGQNPVDLRIIIYPIDRMMASAEKILKTGGDIRAGWLGVLLMDARSELGAGIEIQGVETGSPAQKAGLGARDLLKKYNGKEIQNVRQFIKMVEDTPIGSQADIEILRRGNPVSLTATIDARKPQQNLNRLLSDFFQSLDRPADEDPPSLKVGLEVIGLKSWMADILKIPGQTGLLITNVCKQSPAEGAGVRVGDVIVTLNGRSFPDPMDLLSFIQNNGLGPQLILKILREGAEKTIAIKVPDEDR
jgi:serine protease Do